MAGGHVHALYRHGASPLHRMAPHVKTVAALGFVFAVVATPREAVWAFGLYALGLAALVVLAGLGPRFVASRLVVELPFVLAALALPVLGGGETVDVLGVSLSRQGLWDMWNILAKATLGLGTSIVLAGTTPIPALLRGLGTLRFPRIVTAIAGFMMRYLDVVLSEFRQMRVAMQSRGYQPRWLGNLKPYAASVGILFVRSYERGERVYLAMASRGYAGRMPAMAADAAGPAEWAAALAVPLAAWLVVALAWSVA
ncbi:MAG TPA: cobalt ECF transporter T component CbiQ [Acidimicrobiia bacterium]|jgi:cobalt/nickel transport system permease protein